MTFLGRARSIALPLANLVVDVLARLGLRSRFYRVETVEDLPPHLRRKTLYVVAEGKVQMHAAMACPRGRCSDVVNMNLLPDDDPVWTLYVDAAGRPSLRPSVWRRTSCGCHFWLRGGRLDWC